MKDFKVVFLGAGAINFGTPCAPWNHSTRLEQSVPSTSTELIQGPWNEI
jgi:hypothetical protein